MSVRLGSARKNSIPIHCVDRATFAALGDALDAPSRRWLQTTGFVGAGDSHVLLPAADGGLGAVWAGVRCARDRKSVV